MAKRRLDDEHDVLARANQAAEAQRQAAGHGPSLYEQMWVLLDTRMDNLMSGLAHEDRVNQDKHEARGIAECIALVGNPLVADVNEVRAEAMRRYEARQRVKKPTRRRTK